MTQWNAHSFSPFAVSDSRRAFSVKRRNARLDGRFLYHENAFFSVGDGFEPPYASVLKENQKFWGNQHHLRLTCTLLAWERRLGVLLVPSFPGQEAPVMETGLDGRTEWAESAGRIFASTKARNGRRKPSLIPRRPWRTSSLPGPDGKSGRMGFMRYDMC